MVQHGMYDTRGIKKGRIVTAVLYTSKKSTTGGGRDQVVTSLSMVGERFSIVKFHFCFLNLMPHFRFFPSSDTLVVLLGIFPLTHHFIVLDYLRTHPFQFKSEFSFIV